MADYGILELWGIMVTVDGIMDIMVSWIIVMMGDNSNGNGYLSIIIIKGGRNDSLPKTLQLTA